MENPVITLQSQYLGGGLARLDVLIAHAPKDLFGLAFHLKLEGAEWSLRQSTAGNVLLFPKWEPLFMANQSESHPEELVVGLSARQGDHPDVQDGVVASFLLKGNEGSALTALFYDGHIRLQAHGTPEVANAVWQDSPVVFQAVSRTDFETSLLASPPLVSPSQDLLNAQLIGVYETMGVTFFLLFVILIVFRSRTLRRKKTLT